MGEDIDPKGSRHSLAVEASIGLPGVSRRVVAVVDTVNDSEEDTGRRFAVVELYMHKYICAERGSRGLLTTWRGAITLMLMVCHL